MHYKTATSLYKCVAGLNFPMVEDWALVQEASLISMLWDCVPTMTTHSTAKQYKKTTLGTSSLLFKLFIYNFQGQSQPESYYTSMLQCLSYINDPMSIWLSFYITFYLSHAFDFLWAFMLNTHNDRSMFYGLVAHFIIIACSCDPFIKAMSLKHKNNVCPCKC